MRVKGTDSRSRRRERSDGKQESKPGLNPRCHRVCRGRRVTRPPNHATPQLVSAVQGSPSKPLAGDEFSGSGQINHRRAARP